MKIQLKNKVESLIENYRKVLDAFLAEIRKWEGDSLYAADYRQDRIREVKASMAESDKEFNQQLKTIIAEAKEAIQNSTITNLSDFQMKLANALGFINLLGDKLTDQQAFEMVQPFFNDYQTMKNLFAVISNRYGKESLSVTAFVLGLPDAAVRGLEALESNFSTFFNAGTYTTNGLTFVIGEKVMAADVEAIETIIQKLDNYTTMTYKEAQMVHYKELGVK